MAEQEKEVAKVEAGKEQALDQSKVASTVATETTEAQRKSVSAEAFDKAVARLTAEKWDLKRTVREREDEIRNLKTSASAQPSKGQNVDQQFDQLLGDDSKEKDSQGESQSDIDARIIALENRDRLQSAANQLQVLHERYPEVSADNVLAALERDGKDEDMLETYYLAERGRIADTVRAQVDAKEVAEQKEIDDKSTEGSSKPVRKEKYDEIEDDVEAIKAYRRDKGR